VTHGIDHAPQKRTRTGLFCLEGEHTETKGPRMIVLAAFGSINWLALPPAAVGAL
jgi:hypothetical protein